MRMAGSREKCRDSKEYTENVQYDHTDKCTSFSENITYF